MQGLAEQSRSLIDFVPLSVCEAFEQSLLEINVTLTQRLHKQVEALGLCS